MLKVGRYQPQKIQSSHLKSKHKYTKGLISEFTRHFSHRKKKCQHLYPAGPTWLKNLYFAYTVVLRAITKAAPFWEQEQFYTGDYEDDLHVQKLVKALLAKSK